MTQFIPGLIPAELIHRSGIWFTDTARYTAGYIQDTSGTGTAWVRDHSGPISSHYEDT